MNNVINFKNSNEYILNKLATTKNKDYYYNMTLNQKINYNTVLCIISNFDDVDFILESYNLMCNSRKLSYEEEKAFDLMLGEIFKLTEDYRLEIFYDKACEFLGSTMETIDEEIDKCYDNDEDVYGRFDYVNEMFKNPYIILQFANTILEDVFYNDSASFDEIIHCEVKDVNEITSKKEFILEYLRSVGEFSLADYLKENSNFSFLNYIYSDIDNCLDSWDDYMSKLNINRLGQIEERCKKYESKNHIPKNYLYIVKNCLEKKNQTELLKLFKEKYGDISDDGFKYVGQTLFKKYIYEYINELLEFDVPGCELDFDIIDSEYFNVENDNENEKEKEPCKILKFDNYRKK